MLSLSFQMNLTSSFGVFIKLLKWVFPAIKFKDDFVNMLLRNENFFCNQKK